MKRTKVLIALLLIATLFLVTGCNKEKEVTLGVQDGTNYTNEYFGFSMDIPEEWTVLSEDEKISLMELSADMLTELSKEAGDNLDYSSVQTLNLMFSFKYPLTYVDGPNPNVLCMAENLGVLGSSGITTGEDYIELSKTGLLNSGEPYVFSEIKSTNLGGQDFYMMTASIDYEVLTLTQDYYATIVDGYALTIINTYTTEDEAEETKAIVDSISFN